MSNDEEDFVDRDIDGDFEQIETKSLTKAGQASLSIVGGAIPFAGGLAAWISEQWSGNEQERANQLFLAWFKMIQDELREKHRVLAEVMSRIDMSDSSTSARVASPEYQKLVRKAFRNWNGAESPKKQEVVRNILANAAAARTTSDDVVSLFLDWIADYSEFHFEVISSIFNENGITRYGIWKKLKRPTVREDSAEADLFKLLVRDLSTGGVIRQHRETDYTGNYIKKKPKRSNSGSRTMKSAFDNEDAYELTELGRQFVHYALNNIVPRVEFDPSKDL